MTSIYDIMAWAYGRLCPFDYSKVQECRPEDNREVFNLFARCYEGAGGFPEAVVINIYRQLVAMECRIVDKGQKEHFYYLIIMAIDNYEYRYNSVSSVLKPVKSMESLNKNNESILIYPRMQRTLIDEISDNLEKYEKKELNKRKGGLRKRVDIDTNGINKALNNYIIIEKGDLKQYKIDLHMLQDGGLLAKQVLEKNYLDLLIFPFDDRNIDKVMKIENREKTFRINGYRPEAKLQGRYIQLIERAISGDADIVVFPEMYLSQEMIESAIHKLSSIKTGRSMLIIMGTWWKDNANVCFICNHRGKIIIKQHKQSPFIYKGREEDLQNKEKMLHFLDIDEIGRFAFGVCKDIDNDAIVQKMKTVMSDIYIFPAFSPSLNVLRTAEGIAKSHNGITVFANACAGLCDEKKDRVDVGDKKEVGFITIPCKNKNDSGVKSCHYSIDHQCNGCDGCTGKQIRIRMDNIVKNNEMIYCDISEV